MRTTHIHLSHALMAAGVLLVMFLAIYASVYVSQQAVLVDLVAQWHYLAVAIISLFAGLNAVVPIPAAALTPVFTAAGLSLPGIILALVVGTMVADFIAYLLGSSTKGLLTGHYPRLMAFLEKITTTHRVYLVPFVVVYAAFVPLPNEIMLLPLAFAGIGFGRLLIPLFLGNTINQLWLVYGVELVAGWL